MPRKKRPILRALAIVVMSASSVAGAGAFWAWRSLSQVQRISLGNALSPAGSGGPQNYLVVGSDTRAGADPTDASMGEVGGQRSDTIMVLHLDPSTTSASLLSLPRDLYVTIAGSKKKSRINSAFNRGPEVLVDTVEQTFDIPINHYVQVDFQSFRKLVEALGGVGVWFSTPVKDSFTGFSVAQAGCQTLDGTQALAYARSRHLRYYENGHWKTDGTADLGRIARQQDFVRRAMSKGVEVVSSNPLGVSSLVKAITSELVVDDQLSTSDLLALAQRFQAVTGDRLSTATFPGSGRMINGAAVLIPDMKAGAPLLAPFRSAGTGAARVNAAGPILHDDLLRAFVPSAVPERQLAAGIVGDPTKPCP